MHSSTSPTSATAKSAAVGYFSKSAGVIMFTDLSVVCAERATATIS
jgi:hypothetical protein